MRKSGGGRFITSWEEIIILLLLFQVFVIQWLSYTRYYCLIIDGALLLYLMLHPGCLKKMKAGIAAFLLYLLYCMYQATRAGSHINIFLSNMNQPTTACLIIMSLCFMNANKNKVRRIMVRLFPLINGYMILNIPVLLLQMRGHFELSGRHTVSLSTVFKPDMISGLFGFYGTPILAVFSSFFFVYDLWYIRHHIRKGRRVPYLAYYAAMFLFYLYISIQNENNGYYLILVLFLAVYCLNVQNNYRKIAQRIKRRFKAFILLIVACLAAVIGYNHITPVTNIVDKYLRNYTVGTSTYYAEGSTVRFATVYYFLSQDVNKLFGAGMGAMEWKQNYSFGFKNFGQSDLGSFLLIGGFIFVSLLLLVFATCVFRDNRSVFMTFCESMVVLLLLVYTQPFTSISIMISFMLFILVCGLEKDAADKKGTIRAILIV